MRPDVPWICVQCAEKHGGVMHEDHVATWHTGYCPLCHDLKSLTEPRDFKWPQQ